MRHGILFIIFLFCSQILLAQTHKIAFKTDYGTIKVVLYDFTPQHRDLMVQSIRDSIYQGALFNRIIENFVYKEVNMISILRSEKLQILRATNLGLRENLMREHSIRSGLWDREGMITQKKLR